MTVQGSFLSSSTQCRASAVPHENEVKYIINLLYVQFQNYIQYTIHESSPNNNITMHDDIYISMRKSICST
jgi:hypothetical protein